MVAVVTGVNFLTPDPGATFCYLNLGDPSGPILVGNLEKSVLER